MTELEAKALRVLFALMVTTRAAEYVEGTAMRARPTAIGYLRRDISGVRQEWDETRIRSLARRFGYDLAKIVVFGPATDAPITRLINVARNVDVDAVIVPGLTHFDRGAVPGQLVAVVDVIAVDTTETYGRWLAPIDADGRPIAPQRLQEGGEGGTGFGR